MIWIYNRKNKMTIGELTRLVAKISTDFEENNTDLKK